MSRWLLTGGVSYIRSHVAVELLASGRDVVIVDDLSTGFAAASRIQPHSSRGVQDTKLFAK